MNKRFFTAGRLMGAMRCLMLALTAFSSCSAADDKAAPKQAAPKAEANQ